MKKQTVEILRKNFPLICQSFWMLTPAISTPIVFCVYIYMHVQSLQVACVGELNTKQEPLSNGYSVLNKTAFQHMHNLIFYVIIFLREITKPRISN